MLDFTKLYLLCKRQRASIYELAERKIIPKAVAKALNKDPNTFLSDIRLTNIDAICYHFNCQPSDIMDYVPVPKYKRSKND